jgi:hypothetical protein
MAPPKIQVDVQKVQELRAKGMSLRQIAKFLAVNRAIVTRALRGVSRAGLPDIDPGKPVDRAPAEPVDVQGEIDKFIASIPGGNSLRSYLSPGNWTQFKAKVKAYNEKTENETWGIALSIVHFLRRAANWSVLTLSTVENSPEFQRAKQGMSSAGRNLFRVHVEYIVAHQRRECDVPPEERDTDNCLYNFGQCETIAQPSNDQLQSIRKILTGESHA